jgi:pyridoxal phosphate enzyme (YggS family)
VSGEQSKSGVSPEAAMQLAQDIAQLPRLRLRGLMAIPAPADDESAQRAAFAQLRQLLHELNQQGLSLDTLSMGMSHDFAAAIKEGSTIVRVGTAIFGARQYGEKS